MADISYDSTVVGWATTFSMSVKAPLIKNRIFETVNEAQTYISNAGGSAVAGLILSVILDSEANNGIYQVVVDPSSPNGLNLSKIGGSDIHTNIVRKSIVNGKGKTGGLEVKLATHRGTDNKDYSSEVSYPTYIGKESSYVNGGAEDEPYNGSNKATKALINASGLDVVEKGDIIADEHGQYNEGLKIKLRHTVKPLAGGTPTRADWRREDDVNNINISGLEIHANTLGRSALKGGGATSKGLAVKPGSGIRVDGTGVNTNGSIIGIGKDITSNGSVGGFTQGEIITKDTNIYELFEKLLNKAYDVEPIRPSVLAKVYINAGQALHSFIMPAEGEAKYVEPGFGCYMWTSSQFEDGKLVCDPEGVEAVGHTWLDSTINGYREGGDGFVKAKCGVTIGSVIWNSKSNLTTANIGWNGGAYDDNDPSIPAEVDTNIDGKSHYGKGQLEAGEIFSCSCTVNYTESTNRGYKSNNTISDVKISAGTSTYKTGDVICSSEIFFGFSSAETDHSVNVIYADRDRVATEAIDKLVQSLPVSKEGSATSTRFYTMQKGKTIPSTLGTLDLPNPVIIVPKGLKPVSAIDSTGRQLTATDLKEMFVKQPRGTVYYNYNDPNRTSGDKNGSGLVEYDVYTSYQCEPAEIINLKFE